ncbi:hypothetical protein [Lacrimispora defluvii]|uniref:hypothetical protein n=1 Tax=Lacrimispora defluvii TaxID=2719233 RepID=UPI001A9B870C|nr:hypothetical protein [Lacrimispora defluvii]
MAYMKDITGIQQLDFQINRVIAYGDLAGDSKEIIEKTRGIKDLTTWFHVWSGLVWGIIIGIRPGICVPLMLTEWPNFF